jgi:hypothetical protein
VKSLSLIVWFTQLAVSVAVPLGGAVWLSVWLYNRYQLGAWVIILGVVLGLWWAIDGLRTSLKAMERLAKSDAEENEDQRNG